MTKPPPAANKKNALEAIPLWVFAPTLALSLALGLALFVALPHIVAFKTLRTLTQNPILLNLYEGAVKLVIFIAYLWMVGQRKNIRRVFEFHGAEHKVVYAVENNRELTPDGARDFDTPHPRCGTGFALITVVVSVLCFAFLPIGLPMWQQLLWRIALMPFVAGVSYEIIKLTLHPKLGPTVTRVLAPGMWLQRLTTRQPDNAQLEVACAAMKAVLEAEKAAGESGAAKVEADDKTPAPLLIDG
jgi:uncharacterized protein YqhQ